MAERSKKQSAIQRYFNETAGELRKVSWPTWPEARQLTILVIIVMVAIGLFLGLVDYGANSVLNLALGI
ncbi:MAG TPA: preprotein translocase subunit SecE [Anaerolineales bacterium]